MCQLHSWRSNREFRPTDYAQNFRVVSQTNLQRGEYPFSNFSNIPFVRLPIYLLIFRDVLKSGAIEL